MNVAIYDTSIASPNIGDQIIMDAVNREVEAMFPDAFVERIPTHDRISVRGRRVLKYADRIIAGGANLLFSHWGKQRHWKMGWRDLPRMKDKLVLLGTGWSAYADPPDFLTSRIYRSILADNAYQSVRDAYSARYLSAIGIKNVINTGCPTLWRLTPGHLATIPQNKAQDVVATLTDYAPAPHEDRLMLETLKKQYRKVHVWIQGKEDKTYLNSLGVAGLVEVPSHLSAYDALLRSHDDLDFVGTRLHAGIRALQFGRRSIIVSVDNRAREMGRDFQLPIIERAEMDNLGGLIESAMPVSIKLPQDKIDQFRKQFAQSNS